MQLGQRAWWWDHASQGWEDVIGCPALQRTVLFSLDWEPLICLLLFWCQVVLPLKHTYNGSFRHLGKVGIGIKPRMMLICLKTHPKECLPMCFPTNSPSQVAIWLWNSSFEEDVFQQCWGTVKLSSRIQWSCSISGLLQLPFLLRKRHGQPKAHYLDPILDITGPTVEWLSCSLIVVNILILLTVHHAQITVN